MREVLRKVQGLYNSRGESREAVKGSAHMKHEIHSRNVSESISTLCFTKVEVNYHKKGHVMAAVIIMVMVVL